MSSLPGREWSYASVSHPETLPDGRGLWVAPEVQEIQRKLREGDPLAGWPGDPRLALYRAEKDPRWYLYRLEADGEYRMVVRSKPGVTLETLIPWLVKHDSHRGAHVAEMVNEHNAKLERKLAQSHHERMAESLERVVWGIHRDLGAQA